MASPTIHVGPFSDKTWREWLVDPFKRSHDRTVIRTMKAGDIVVGTLNSTVVVVYTLKGVCTPRDLMDLDTYSGEDAQYNNYYIPIDRHWILPAPVPFEAVAGYCGCTVADTARTNLFKRVQMSHSKAFYKGDDAEGVLGRYRTLVESWMSVVEAPAAPAAPAAAAQQALLAGPTLGAPVKKEARDYLMDGETIYNTVQPKGQAKETWSATYTAARNAFVMDDGRHFATPHEFSATHRKEKGLTGSVRGWHACYVVYNNKRTHLCDLMRLLD